MISEHPLTLRVLTCANGETHEYRLTCGGYPVGNPCWLSGRPTPKRRAKALRLILNGVSDGSYESAMRS